MDESLKTMEADASCGTQEEVKLSKNQLKKQRKREKWLAVKQEKRRQYKLKRKQRFAEMREKGENLGPSRKSLKTNTMKNSSCKIKVVIDLSLDHYMTEKDINSLTCQLQHSYSSNRRAENPMQLYLCGLCGKTKQRLDDIGDYNGWDMYKETKDYTEVFPKESLVYLSSESPNMLSTLSEDKVYIIGGLVDHNQQKGLCHKIAEEKGIAHAQLPISEYLNMKSRKVLAVNHVVAILLRYTETHDWKEAFLAEMPQRKQAHGKEESQGTSNSGTDGNPEQCSKDSSSQSCESLKRDDEESQEVGMVSEKMTGAENESGVVKPTLESGSDNSCEHAACEKQEENISDAARLTKSQETISENVPSGHQGVKSDNGSVGFL